MEAFRVEGLGVRVCLFICITAGIVKMTIPGFEGWGGGGGGLCCFELVEMLPAGLGFGFAFLFMC